MKHPEISSCAALEEFIASVGFLPLLSSGPYGWSAEEVVDEECGYVVLPGGGWEWPLWDWKGDILRETGCAYGKFFGGKAGFISREWWPCFCAWRRSAMPLPGDGSVEEMIVETLAEGGPMITRELRAACGFTGPKMRGRFDAYVARLMMACRIVTEDFVYPTDRNGQRYGWGWAKLTTPEARFGHEACNPALAPREARERVRAKLVEILPDADEKYIDSILK